LTLLVGHQEEHPSCKNYGVGVVICLERGADCLHMVQLMPLHPKTPSSLASFKSRLVICFCCQLTQVVLEKRLLNGCSSSSSLIQYTVTCLPKTWKGHATPTIHTTLCIMPSNTHQWEITIQCYNCVWHLCQWVGKRNSERESDNSLNTLPGIKVTCNSKTEYTVIVVILHLLL